MKKILFNDKYGLTRAVLDGRKTMTRRIANPISENIDKMGKSKTIISSYRLKQNLYYPQFEVGEIVAVAERYSVLHERLKDTIREKRKDDSLEAFHRAGICDTDAGWRNKMFVRADLMPHQIRIKNVRIGRLQNISDEDCMKEGIRKLESSDIPTHFTFDGWMFNNRVFRCADTPREAFSALFNKLSGKGAWDKNPWVFVYEFELLR